MEAKSRTIELVHLNHDQAGLSAQEHLRRVGRQRTNRHDIGIPIPHESPQVQTLLQLDLLSGQPEQVQVRFETVGKEAIRPEGHMVEESDLPMLMVLQPPQLLPSHRTPNSCI